MPPSLIPHAGHVVAITDEGELRCLSCAQTLEVEAEPEAEQKKCAYCGRFNSLDVDLCQSCQDDDDIQRCGGCDKWFSVDSRGQCDSCEQCGNCCECDRCDSCGDAADTCGRCDCCDDCCKCVTCSECGCRVSPDNICCGECERCSDCGCGCESEESDEGEEVPF